MVAEGDIIEAVGFRTESGKMLFVLGGGNRRQGPPVKRTAAGDDPPLFRRTVGAVIFAAQFEAAFDGFRAATINWQSFSQVAFAFDVTPALVGLGIVAAVIIGLIGGFLPALRAMSMPLAPALREA